MVASPALRWMHTGEPGPLVKPMKVVVIM